MTNVLKYQGYSARIEFDAEDEVFVVHVLGIADQISFHSESVAAQASGKSLNQWAADAIAQAAGKTA